MANFHKNFAYSTIVTAPSPATTGTALTIQDGHGPIFPTPPFNATVWPTGVQPLATNAEIVRVTNIADDTFTIVRQQEGTSARTVVAGDQIAATVTNNSLVEAESTFSTYSPYILSSSGTGLQTLASATGQSATGSLFVFPVTIPGNLQFNQVLIGNSISIVSSTNTTISNSYYSRYGIYSMNANTLSLISSSSFSIGETLQNVSATWNYPTTTHTTWGYGNFPAGNLTATAQLMSFIGSARVVGLQFGGNMSLTGGVYWLALLSQRSTGNASTYGMSHMGIIGQAIASVNQVGTSSTNNGILPVGYAYSNWSESNSHLTGWWGRHIIGFVTATSIANQLGTAIPPAITLSALGGVAANLTATILPTVTFVST